MWTWESTIWATFYAQRKAMWFNIKWSNCWSYKFFQWSTQRELKFVVFLFFGIWSLEIFLWILEIKLKLNRFVLLTTINTNHTRTQINEKQINMKLFRTKGEIKKKESFHFFGISITTIVTSTGRNFAPNSEL